MSSTPYIVLQAEDPLGRKVVMAKTTYDYKRVQHQTKGESVDQIRVTIEDPDSIFESQHQSRSAHRMYFRSLGSRGYIQKVVVDHCDSPGKVVTFHVTDGTDNTGPIEYMRR
ncbi:MAG: hypothetical protein PF636_04060 [Actinomycetota bacterium]|jgi:hypothetical protein|nr:hypothetical protein [Actinomycetota bacterium]